MAWKKRSRVSSYVPPKREEVVMGPVTIAEPYDGLYISNTEKQVAELNTYQSLVETREKDVEGTKGTDKFLDGEDKWTWIKQDDGAWDGPARDWYSEHRHKYFKHVKRFDVVISAGANQGMYIRFLAKKFGTVYAFEPDPLNFHCMVVNNQVDNVIKMNCGLGEKPGWAIVERTGFNNTGTWHLREDQPSKRVPVMSLDAMNFPTIDLIQLDVEGYEFNILKGAKESIKAFRPIITAENGRTPDISRLLEEELNYKFADQSSADAVWVPKEFSVLNL
jgi:FkbM family methyltransferase